MALLQLYVSAKNKPTILAVTERCICNSAQKVTGVTKLGWAPIYYVVSSMPHGVSEVLRSERKSPGP